MMTLRTARLLLRDCRDVMERFPRRLDREQSDALAGRLECFVRERGVGLWAVEVPGVARSSASSVSRSRPRLARTAGGLRTLG